MTEKQINYKKSLIQKIQINKKNVFPDDETRRDFMESRFNCNSTKDMSIEQLNQLLNFCLKKVSDIPMETPITKAQKKKINDLWNEKARDKSSKALNIFITRQTQRTEIIYLTKTEATKVIIALTKME